MDRKQPSKNTNQNSQQSIRPLNEEQTLLKEEQKLHFVYSECHVKYFW